MVLRVVGGLDAVFLCQGSRLAEDVDLGAGRAGVVDGLQSDFSRGFVWYEARKVGENGKLRVTREIRCDRDDLDGAVRVWAELRVPGSDIARRRKGGGRKVGDLHQSPTATLSYTPR